MDQEIRIRQTDITVEGWDLSDIFVYAVEHLRKQGRRAVKLDACVYRGDNCKCVIGAFIPDVEYRERFENENVWGLTRTNGYIAPAFRMPGVQPYKWASETHNELASRLQSAHDVQNENINTRLWRVQRHFSFGDFERLAWD